MSENQNNSNTNNKPRNKNYSKKRSFNRNKNRRPNNNNNNDPKQAAAGQNPNQGQSQNRGDNKPSNNNSNRRNYKNRNRNKSQNREYKGGDPRTLTPQKVIMHYDHLLEQHTEARQKYFEMYHRGNAQQKEKYEKRFNQTLEALREFETIINPDNKKVLMERIESYPRDLFYSDSHGIDPDSSDPLPTTIDDIHMNDVQKSRPSYASDTEETEGSMEDYYKYKGQPVPQKSFEDQKS